MFSPYWKKNETSVIHRKICQDPSILLEQQTHRNIFGWTPQKLKNLLFMEKKTMGKVIDLIDRDGKQQRYKLEELANKLSFSYLNHLVFESPSYLYKSASEAFKMQKKQSVNQEMRWLEAFYGDDFDQKKEQDFYIKYIHPLIGHGVFAKKGIATHSLIGEYTGIVRKRRGFYDRNNQYIFSYVNCGKDTSYVVDAEKRGNFTRFINHSADPNLYSRCIMKENVCHVALITKQYIPVDAQLTLDYGPFYWKHRPHPITI